MQELWIINNDNTAWSTYVERILSMAAVAADLSERVL